MRKPLGLLAIIALATIALGQTSAAPISASAVWQPGTDFVASAHAACDKTTPSAQVLRLRHQPDVQGGSFRRRC